MPPLALQYVPFCTAIYGLLHSKRYPFPLEFVTIFQSEHYKPQSKAFPTKGRTPATYTETAANILRKRGIGAWCFLPSYASADSSDKADPHSFSRPYTPQLDPSSRP